VFTVLVQNRGCATAANTMLIAGVALALIDGGVGRSPAALRLTSRARRERRPALARVQTQRVPWRHTRTAIRSADDKNETKRHPSNKGRENP
jgi:hypothetical protein